METVVWIAPAIFASCASCSAPHRVLTAAALPCPDRGAAGLSELTSRTVRDKFARLGQTATVLGLESAEEAADLVGDGAAAWRLTAADVRQALSQRVEFDAADRI